MQACYCIHEGKELPQTGMTALVKGAVARGQALPPEAHVFKYARGVPYTIHSLMVKVSLVIFPSYDQLKKINK